MSSIYSVAWQKFDRNVFICTGISKVFQGKGGENYENFKVGASSDIQDVSFI